MILTQKEQWVSEQVSKHRKIYERNLKIRKKLLEWWLPHVYYCIYVFRAKYLKTPVHKAVAPCWNLNDSFRNNFSQTHKPALLKKYREEYDKNNQEKNK